MNYIINEERILFSQLGDEAVIFDKKNNEYVTLNETMFKIFESISNGNSLETIKESLIGEFEVDEETCVTAIESSIKSLLDKEFLLVN
jgi:antirestriction protein